MDSKLFASNSNNNIEGSSKLKKVAIVTGGTRGIGLGIAKILALNHYDLILGYNTDETRAKESKQMLQDLYHDTNNNNNIEIHLVKGDIAQAEQISKSYMKVIQDFFPDGIDALVLNAGQYLGVTSENCDNITLSGGTGTDGRKIQFTSLLKYPLVKMQSTDTQDNDNDNDDDNDNAHEGGTGGDGGPYVDMSHFDYYHKLYARGPIILIEKILPFLRFDGSIITISSPGCNMLQNPNFGYDMPGSGKTVLEYATRYYAKYLATKGIRVNCIIPGVIPTDAWSRTYTEEKKNVVDENSIPEICKEFAAKKVPMQRVGSPSDIGETIAFLVSDKARYITGLIMPVDGGLHLNM